MCERDKKGKQGREQHNSLKSGHVVSLHGLDVQRLTKVRIDAQQCEKPMLFLYFPQRYHFLTAVTQMRENCGTANEGVQ
jgi:hypothetical protein